MVGALKQVDYVSRSLRVPSSHVLILCQVPAHHSFQAHPLLHRVCWHTTTTMSDVDDIHSRPHGDVRDNRMHDGDDDEGGDVEMGQAIEDSSEEESDDEEEERKIREGFIVDEEDDDDDEEEVKERRKRHKRRKKRHHSKSHSLMASLVVDTFG